MVVGLIFSVLPSSVQDFEDLLLDPAREPIFNLALGFCDSFREKVAERGHPTTQKHIYDMLSIQQALYHKPANKAYGVVNNLQYSPFL